MTNNVSNNAEKITFKEQMICQFKDTTTNQTKS